MEQATFTHSGIDQFVMISGCSGGGKSTLLAELNRRGFSVVEEPGRRILAEERANGGSAFPWSNPEAFAQRALAMSVADHAGAYGLTFFDRGVVDAAVAVVAAGGDLPTVALSNCRYALVCLAPPWPEIYENDEDRRHSLEVALRDYERVRRAYDDAGYTPVELPRDSVEARADFILGRLQPET